MLDILIIMICLSVTAIVAWREGAKYERRKADEQEHMRKRLNRYCDDRPLTRTWD